MNTSLRARIEGQKKVIRKSQLNSFFLAQRQQLCPLDRSSALDELIPLLDRLRLFAVREDDPSALVTALRRLHCILGKFDALSVMIRGIDFPASQVAQMQLGPHYREMTWIDLILYLLCSFGEEMTIENECAFILSRCAAQIKDRAVRNKQKQGHLHSQLLRLTQNYPYELLLTHNYVAVESSLSLLTDLCLACTNGSAVYLLVNRRNPGILTILNSLLESGQVVQMESVQGELFNAAVTLIYFVSHYNYSKFEEAEFRLLAAKTKTLLLQELQRSQSSQALQKTNWHLRLLLESGAASLSRSEFLTLEDLFLADLEQGHFHLALAFNAVMEQTSFSLRTETLRQVLRVLFDEQQEGRLLGCLVTIVRNHTINCGNRFREQQAELFLSFWGQFGRIDRLLGVLAQLRQQENHRAVSQMFGLVEIILRAEGSELGALTTLVSKQQIDELFTYDDFRAMMNQTDYEPLSDCAL